MRTSLVLVLMLAACSTAPSPSAAPTSPPGEPVEIAAWGAAGDRIDLDDPLGFSEILDMAPFGDGFVAVGGDALGAATWSSDDGLGWTKSPANPDLADGVMWGVTASGGRLVAWGAIRPLPWDDTPAAWVSDDGINWQRAEGLPTSGSVRAIEASPPGWLAFVADSEGRGFHVLTSPDGTNWALANDGVASDKVLLAIGSRRGGFAALLASAEGNAMWHSDTGLDWRPQGMISGAEDGTSIASLADNDATIVAVGDEWVDNTEPSAIAWSSRDGGRTWTKATIDPVQPTSMHRVDAFEGGFLAIGTVSGGPDDAQSVAWSSFDGRAWTRLGLGPRDNQLVGLRFVDGTAIAWGIGREGDARIWASPAPNPAFSDDPPPGIDCPAAAPTFRDVVLTPRDSRLECIGGAPVSGLAYLQPKEGLGGVCPTVEPTWLTCDADAYFAAAAGPRVRELPVVFEPAVAFDLASLGWFALTGQLDHPAAQTCVSSVPVDAAQAAQVIADCRATFVVTEITPVAGP